MIFDRYIAHRGLHNIDKGIPENSLAAFKAAADKGFPIELDVHLSKDGRIVVFHDNNLKRMTGIDKKINELGYDEIKDLRLSGTDEKIPLLVDVLKLVRGRVPLLIELKNTSMLFELENRLCRTMQNYSGYWAIQSFNPLRVGWFARHCPSIERGQLISTFKGENLEKRKLAAMPIVWKTVSKPTFISCDLRSISLDVLFSAHDIGAKVITWTANTPQLLKAAEQFSRGIIFEQLTIDG